MDRFKALKVLSDDSNAIDEEMQGEYRNLELIYEKLYEDVFRQRDLLIEGKVPLNQDLIVEFNQKLLTLELDEDFKKYEPMPFEV